MSARAMSRASHREAVRRARRLSRRARAGAGVAAAATATALSGGVASAATFPVSTNADSGAGSLRQAVLDANAVPGADTITFTGAVASPIGLASGDLDVTGPLTVQGPGAAALTISGNNNSRIFNIVGPNVAGGRMPVTISGVTLTNGQVLTDTAGGAILGEYVDFKLQNSVVRNSYSGDGGGGIYLDSAVVTITGSEIVGNESNCCGGGLYVDADEDVTAGPTDTVTVTDSRIDSNAATGNGGGVYVDDEIGGKAIFTRVTVIDNQSVTRDAGGIQFYGHHEQAIIRESTISGNTADEDGGGIRFDTGYPTDPGGLLIENSTITGNTSGEEGGGVYVYNGENKPVEIRNSTIAANTATTEGGGIFRFDNDVTLSSTIVADNLSSTAVSADLAQRGAATGTFLVGNSLFVNAVGATITGTAPNVTGVSPQLGALADNGGPTLTMLPATTSPVVDKGAANGLLVDQRGLARTASGRTDIGAVEIQPPTPPIPPTPPDTAVTGAQASAPGSQTFKKKIKVTVEAQAGEDATVDATGSIKAGKGYGLKTVTGQVKAGQKTTLTLVPSKGNASKKVAKALAKKGKKASATVALSLKFTDAAGNVDTKTVSTKLKLKVKKK